MVPTTSTTSISRSSRWEWSATRGTTSPARATRPRCPSRDGAHRRRTPDFGGRLHSPARLRCGSHTRVGRRPDRQRGESIRTRATEMRKSCQFQEWESEYRPSDALPGMEVLRVSDDTGFHTIAEACSATMCYPPEIPKSPISNTRRVFEVSGGTIFSWIWASMPISTRSTGSGTDGGRAHGLSRVLPSHSPARYSSTLT